MKIEDSNQKMAVMHQQMSNRADKPEATGAQAQSDSVVKPQQGGDKVELSGMKPMSPEMASQQAARAQRVEDIKAQVQAGTYAVDSRAVAEKMLTKLAGSKTVH